jgi:SAM-dependent methyltransferase
MKRVDTDLTTDTAGGELKVDLGCGTCKRKGFVGIDIFPSPGVDYVLDVTKEPLPFEDNSVCYVYSHHLLEHISDPHFVLQEITRVCRDGAVVEIWCPYLKSNDAFVPGHVSFYQELSWEQLCITLVDECQKDFRARLILRHFKYVLYPAIEEKLRASNIPLLFALEHLHGIAFDFCAYMTVARPGEGTATPRPEMYVAYSRDEHFRKLPLAGVTPLVRVSPNRIARVLGRIGANMPSASQSVLRPLYRFIFERH